MALIPVQVGDRKAIIDKPERSKCGVPGCSGDHWTSCEYPVGAKLATTRTCDAKLCEGCVVKWGQLEICPSHGRLVARGGK
jgi:hypothetical protein